MAADTRIDIEVIYARPAEQTVVALKVAPGTTVDEAIQLSGLPARFREIDDSRIAAGIYGRRVARDAVLAPGDRVEIYRPLTADPKQARRRRAARQR